MDHTLSPFEIRQIGEVYCPRLNDYINYVRWRNRGASPYGAFLYWQDVLSVFRDRLYQRVCQGGDIQDKEIGRASCRERV